MASSNQMEEFVDAVMRVALEGRPNCATVTPEDVFVASTLEHHVSGTAESAKGDGHGGVGLHRSLGVLR